MRLAALLALSLLAACTQATEPGGQASAAPTIVSLNPCSDAVLAEVAAPGQLLAVSHYSQDPASSSMDLEAARTFRAVSGSVEEVLALDPDVVVAGSFLPPATRSAFDRLGIRVVTVPIATSVEESREQVLALAELAGRREQGVLLRSRIDAALARAAVPRDHVPVEALVWQAGGIVPGKDTLIADLLSRTGFESFSAAKGMGQADHLSLEQVLADPPRVILFAGDSRRAEDRLLYHPALADLRITRRAPFDPSLLWCGGATLVHAAERLAQVRRTLGMPQTEPRSAR